VWAILLASVTFDISFMEEACAQKRTQGEPSVIAPLAGTSPPPSFRCVHPELRSVSSTKSTTLNIVPIRKVKPDLYDAYIQTHPDANVYHTRAWSNVLQASYGYAPATLVALDAPDEIVGVLPLMRVNTITRGRRLVSLPFSHCVPILTNRLAVEHALLSELLAIAHAEHVAYVELKPRRPVDHPAFVPTVLNRISELDLTPELDQLFESFTSSNRRNIRKTERAGFTLREGNTHADYDSFHALEVATRRRQGSPVYPRSFFHDVAKKLPQQSHLYLLSYNGHDVAGMVVFWQEKRCIYGYGAALRSEDFDELNGLHPSNLLVWHAIQEARAAGCAVFDFGTTPLHNEGLLDFKQRYNPVTEELQYWYYLHTKQNLPIIRRDSPSVKSIESVLRCFPRPLFSGLTPILLRELG
jgi:lipid II:glycine glycyltransferase (peptidoglycan interpeptide bridge formation enzyme)